MPLDVLQPVRYELPDFLKRAIVWPRPGDGSFVSMHIWYKRDGTKGGFPGTPCYSEADVTRFLSKNAGKYDIYVCMSTQTRRKDNGQTERGREYAGLLRSIYIDVDWGKANAAVSYVTEQEMLTDIARVIAAIGLPPPTFVINTGGGRHLHWVLTQPVQPDRWQKLADSLYNACEQHRLKFDAGVGVDCSRVMRVPGTFNRKQPLPRPVLMDPASGLAEYDLVILETILLPYHGQGRLRSAPSRRIIERPASFVGAVLDPAFQASTVPPHGDDRHLPKPEDLATGCPWIADMLATGGNGYPEPLWKEGMNVACHVQDGEATAHRFSQGDPRYVPADTERKYQTQKALGLGWPSCVAIARAGSVQCKTCPHLQVSGGSPFRFMVAPRNSSITAQPLPVAGFAIAAPSTVVGLNGMPYGYSYGSDGRVSRKDDQGVEKPVCGYSFYGGRLIEYAFNDTRLSFETDIGHKRREIEVPQVALADSRALHKRLSEQDFVINDPQQVKKFMASWIQTLQETVGKIPATPAFGWHNDGFVFDRTLFAGTDESEVLPLDPEIDELYRSKGQRSRWDEAVRTVLARNNPGLNVILATALAGPLVRFTAEDGLWLHAVSPPGGNKTTANRVAVAFWGSMHSKLGKDDTQLSVQKKMETVRHITVFHDDLQVAPDNVGEVAKFAMAITSGQGRGRLTQDAKQRPIGYWSTMYSSNGNLSVRDAFSEYSRRTTAAHTRVFEILVPPVGNAGRLDMGTAVQTINRVNDNYGHAGRIYAKYLGSNADHVEAMVTKTVNALQKAYKCTDEERFWVCTIAVLLVGAELGRHLGLIPFTSHALLEMREYLAAGLKANRSDMEAEHSEATAVSVPEHVREYLGANIGERGVVVEKGNVAACNPRAGRFPVTIIIEVNRDTRTVWFMRSHFTEWLRQRRLARRAVLSKLAEMKTLDVSRPLCEGCQAYHGPRVRLIGISMDSPDFPGLPA